VVVHEDETGSGGKGVVLGEDRLVTLRRGKVSDVEVGITTPVVAVVCGMKRHWLSADQPGEPV
jgi:hypothetical protein